MEISGKTIKFSNTLWVQLGGVRVKNEKESVLVEGVDDDSYLKVFNHFGRVLKLYTFEEGQWVDSATGAAPTALDESLAGLVPAAKRTSTIKATVKATVKAAAKPARTKASGKAAVTGKATAKTAVKTKAKPAAAARGKTSAGKAARAKSAGNKKAKPKSTAPKKAGAGKVSSKS